MLVHRMVKDIKNSKVLHKIKTKDAYTAQQLYQQFKSQHLLDDRREYDEEDLMSAYPGLSKEEAKKLFDMLQRSTDAADLSLSKDNLIDAMGSGYTPVHVQKNRQGVFIVFKSDKDGKFYIVEKRSKQLFSVATSLAMAKRIIGETEDSKSKDADPRGFKVNDQIIKGFMVYKMDKNPALFVAKNENGKEFEGTMEQIKKQIDDYWVKQDEDVMKQKMKDEESERGIIQGVYYTIYPYQEGNTTYYNSVVKNDKTKKKVEQRYMSLQEASNDIRNLIAKTFDSKTKDVDMKKKKFVEEYKGWDIYENLDKWAVYKYWGSSKQRVKGAFLTTQGDNLTQIKNDIDNQIRRTSDSKTEDSKPKHPRWRIKDDKLFRLRSAVKDIRRRVKDAELNGRAVWKKEDFDKMVASGNFVIVSKQPWGYEVRVKSGNIYGVEIKDSYTKGSADRKTKDDYRSISLEELQDKAKQGYFELQGDPKLRNHIEVKYPNGKKEWLFIESLSKAKDKYTGDPLTKKGNKILAKMRERYGKKKGESVFYASKNKGTIAGVDGKTKDGEYNVLKGKLDKIKREIERYEKAGQENSPEYKDLKKQEAKLGYDLMAYINRPKDSKSKDQAPDLKSKIVAFFKANPNPPDSVVHAFAEKEGIDPDEMETQIYKLVTEHVGGK